MWGGRLLEGTVSYVDGEDRNALYVLTDQGSKISASSPYTNDRLRGSRTTSFDEI